MEYKPLDGRQFPRFAGIKTFFRLPYAEIKEIFDVALMGVPFDGGVSYRPGARFGPTKVREMSSLGRGFHMTHQTHFFSKLKVADVGDCSVVPMGIEATHAKIQATAAEVLKSGKKLISVGGDHSSTLPLLRAFRAQYGVPLSIIHFDAHLDTYPAAWGVEFHHGTFMRHAINEGLVNPKTSMQIGIRGPLAGKDDLDFPQKAGIKITTVDDIRIGGLENFLKNLPAFHGPTYISFDVDCLDPAYAPGTGTPVPGGLTTYETQRILRALKIENLAGADVVEFSPPYDHSDITALAAVDTMFEFLSQMALPK
ncbi:MAG: agmatinase [Bdellovibrionales bacterium]|nr:agmatinase [Bdellovibrionales bacterium]